MNPIQGQKYDLCVTFIPLTCSFLKALDTWALSVADAVTKTMLMLGVSTPLETSLNPLTHWPQMRYTAQVVCTKMNR